MPVVLVHGYGVAGRYWRPLAQRLRSAGRQLVRLLLSAPAEHPAILPLILGDYLRVGAARLLAELRLPRTSPGPTRWRLRSSGS